MKLKKIIVLFISTFSSFGATACTNSANNSIKSGNISSEISDENSNDLSNNLQSDNGEESTDSGQSGETFYELSIPQNIQFRGIDYYMITESGDFFSSNNVDSVIAFLINEEDLSFLSLINPQNEYCVVSGGSLFYAYGQPIFPIWSIHDLDIKDAIVISSPNETMRFLFRNCI